MVSSKMTLDKDIYTYREFPWISKSKILAYRFCPHLFDLRYNKGIDMGVSLKGESGLNLHALYAKFFRVIDFQKLQKIPIDYTKPIKESPIYDFFYKTMMEMIPLPSRKWEPYQLMTKSFCLAETAHWIDLNQYYQENISKVLKYFIPSMLEKYIECPQIKVFGTIDRGHRKHDENDMLVVLDYKTGHVPADIKRGIQKVGDPYSWKLNYKKNFELHFYLLLYMCHRGYKIDPAITQYVNKELYTGAKFPAVKDYFMKTNGDPFDFTKEFIVSIFYTGEGEVYIPQKRPTKRSMRTVFIWINKIRTIRKNEGPYNKEPQYWKCRECNEAIRDQCLTEVEKEMIFWSKKEEKEK